MAAKLFFLPHLTATVNGIAVPGAKASFYQTGTTTPLAVYQDAALSVPHTSPVVANGAGRFPAIYLDDTVVYRLILTDRDDAELSGGDIDPFLAGIVPDASALQPYQTACEAAAVAASASADDADTSATTAAASATTAANAATDAIDAETNSEAAAVLAALAAEAAQNAVSVSNASLNASTRGVLSLLGTSLPAILAESGREGIFVFDASDLSSSVAADTEQGIYVAPASDTTGASGAWVRKFNGTLLPEFFGAVGDGLTDDSNAMRAWASASGKAHSLGRGKTYLVSPATAGAIIIPLTSPKTIIGNGGTIKVKNNSGEYTAIIGSDSFADDLSGTAISGVTFDHNQANNTFGVTTGLLNNPHSTFRVRSGTDVDFIGNTIRNAACTNSVYLNGWQSGGAIQSVKRARVNRNRWLDVGGTAADFDHSTIYVHGEDIECHGNTCVGLSLGAYGTKCFFEPHGTYIRAMFNEVRNMQGFANVTGIYSGGDTELSHISHNTADVLQFGVRIFSLTYEDHVSGYGVNGLRIESNDFRIHQTLLAAGSSLFYFGVCFQPGSTLAVKDVWIKSNKIVYDEETVAASYTASAPAVGVSETTGTIVYERVIIDDNEIVNAPNQAIALGNGGGVFKDCAITPANRILNAAQSKTIVPTGYAIILFGNEYQGSLEVGAKIFDLFATARLVGGVYAAPTNSSTSALVRVQLDIYLTGTTVSSFGRPFRNGSAKLAPLVSARMNKSVNPALSEQTGLKPGSAVQDTANGVLFEVMVSGGALTSKNYIAAINATSGTTYTTTTNELFNVRRLTSATPVTVTIAPSSSVSLPVGAWMEFEQAGAGAITFSAGAGVTLLGSATTSSQYQAARWRQVATDTWVRYQ